MSNKLFQSIGDLQTFLNDVAKAMYQSPNASFAFLIGNTGTFNTFQPAIVVDDDCNDPIMFRMSFGNGSNYPRKHQFNITQLDEMFTKAYPTIMLRGEQVMRLNYFIEHFCTTSLLANDICKQTISRLKYAINHYNDITLYEIARKDTNSSYLDSVWRTYKSNVVGSFTSFEEFVIWVQLNCQK